MAKSRSKRGTTVDRAAEGIGDALGSLAGTIESLQAQHPHPVDEARDALTAGQKKLSVGASKAGTRAAAVIKKAKSAVKSAKKAVARSRPKPTPLARATRAAKSAVKSAKKAIARGRTTVKRAAKRLKR